MAQFEQVQRVLWRVLFANLAVAFAKLIGGLLSGALSMVADGFHSLIDSSSNLIGIAGARIAGRPPDSDHPYGHRRYETLATLAIGGFLLVAAWEILTASIERLFNGGEVEVTPLSFVIMVSTILINITVTTYETAQGKRLRSEVLLADAAQTRVDVFVSLSVIGGLIMTGLGVAWMDTVLALLIVVLIGWTAYGILRSTSAVLVDSVALDPAELQRIVERVPGVADVVRVRSRGPADAVHADVEVRVQPATTADRAEAIAAEIQNRVKAEMEGIAEIQVQFSADHINPQDRTVVARAAADALGLSIHEVTEIVGAQGMILEMHVEVSPVLSLSAAHERVSELERRVCETLIDVVNVITHIEPQGQQAGAILYTTGAIEHRDQALQLANRLYPDANWHDVTIRPIMGGYAMTIDCQLPGTISVQEAHAIAEDVETQIRASLPQVLRVTIHTEPRDAEARDG